MQNRNISAEFDEDQQKQDAQLQDEALRAQAEKEDSNPLSPSATGVNPERKAPKSLNPLRTYEEAKSDLEATNAPSQEEQDLAKRAQDLGPSEGDATARFGAQLTDIIGSGFQNYAAAKGVPGAGQKPFTTATDAMKAQMDAREQLRKNMLSQVEAKKAEREEKRKALYDRLGTETKLAGEQRAMSAEDRATSEFTQKQKLIADQEAPLTPEQQKMYSMLAKQRGITIDPSTAKQKDIPELEKAIGLAVKPEKVKAATGLDAAVSPAIIDQINAARPGRPPIPYGTTARDMQALGFNEGELRRLGLSGQLAAVEPFDPLKVTKGSTQEREYKTLNADATKIKEKSAQTQGDLEQLSSLITSARSGNQAAASAAQRQIALLFNKGALSDQDVTAFSGAQDVVSRIRRWADRNFLTGALVTGADGSVSIADKDKYMDADPSDLDQFEKLIPALKTGSAKVRETREADIRRRAAIVHPGMGDYLFGSSGQQPSTSASQGGTIGGSSVKMKLPDGRVVQIKREMVEAAKAKGAIEVQ